MWRSGVAPGWTIHSSTAIPPVPGKPEFRLAGQTVGARGEWDSSPFRLKAFAREQRRSHEPENESTHQFHPGISGSRTGSSSVDRLPQKLPEHLRPGNDTGNRTFQIGLFHCGLPEFLTPGRLPSFLLVPHGTRILV